MATVSPVVDIDEQCPDGLSSEIEADRCSVHMVRRDSAEHAAMDVEHAAELLELGDPVAIHAVDMIAVEVGDERVHVAVEPGKGVWPVVLADGGDLVVLRRRNRTNSAGTMSSRSGRRGGSSGQASPAPGAAMW